MNKQVAIDLIAVLGRSSDKALIHRVLLKLRSDLVGRNSSGIDLFFRLNGIPPLVRLISKPYEKILDVALSILANCCVHKQCCKQVNAGCRILASYMVFKQYSDWWLCRQSIRVWCHHCCPS